MDKELLEYLLDKVLRDISNITNIEERDLLYSSLAKLYLPEKPALKKIVLALYADKITLNEAYAKTLLFLKDNRTCLGTDNIVVPMLSTIESLVSDEIYVEDEIEQCQKKKKILAKDKIAFCKQHWASLEISKETYLLLADLCQMDKTWELTPERRVQILNQIVLVSEVLGRTAAENYETNQKFQK